MTQRSSMPSTLRLSTNTFSTPPEKNWKQTFAPPIFPQLNPPSPDSYTAVNGQKAMYRRPAGKRNPNDTVLCKTHGCPTVGSFYYLVEERLIQFLEKTLKDYRIRIQVENTGDWTEVLARKKTVLSEYKNEADVLNKQLESVYDYFEQQVYSLDLFRKRSGDLNKKLGENEKLIKSIERDMEEIKERIIRKEKFIPYFENVPEILLKN